MQKALPFVIVGGIAVYLLLLTRGNLIDAIGTLALAVLFFGALGVLGMILGAGR